MASLEAVNISVLAEERRYGKFEHHHTKSRLMDSESLVQSWLVHFSVS